jgi:transcriptional regulator
VPTWNYGVVHAYGQPEVIEAKSWLLDHVTQLTKVHEAGQALPWEVSDAPRDSLAMAELVMRRARPEPQLVCNAVP